MALYAPVCPPQILRGLRALGDDIVGKYHLLLAHDVHEHPELYRDVLPSNSMIIMDNGTIELGHPVSLREMRSALDVVPAQIIVLPDVIKDSQKTLEMSTAAATEWLPLLHTRGSYLSEGKFMAVPQGKSFEELQSCALALAELPNVGAWGVGRFITDMLGSRIPFIEWLRDTKETQLPNGRFTPFIHLFGFSENLQDDIAASNIPKVMGIDSAVPIRLGQHGFMIDPHQKTHIPRGDWWDKASGQIRAETLANLLLFRSWIQKPQLALHRYLEDGKRAGTLMS
jgi:hypothetical protein